MFKKIIAIASAVLIICVIVNNIIKASQMPKFPEAIIVENHESDYVDFIIGDKRYEVIESQIADRDIDMTDKVAMYKDEVSIIFKYTSFYSVKNAPGCDMLVDDTYNSLFCNVEEAQEARVYYSDLNNYNFYGMKSDKNKGFLEKKDFEKATEHGDINKEFFNAIERVKLADYDASVSMEIGISDDEVKEWYTLSAVSEDGLVQKDYEFVLLDDGWYYFFGIWVTDDEAIDYKIVSIDSIRSYM